MAAFGDVSEGEKELLAPSSHPAFNEYSFRETFKGKSVWHHFHLRDPKKQKSLMTTKLITLMPCKRDQVLGHFQLAFEQKIFWVSNLLTLEDLILNSRGAGIKGRALLLRPLIWAFIFWQSAWPPLRLRVQWQQQPRDALLLCSQAEMLQTWGRKSWACAKTWVWLDSPSGVNSA